MEHAKKTVNQLLTEWNLNEDFNKDFKKGARIKFVGQDRSDGYVKFGMKGEIVMTGKPQTGGYPTLHTVKLDKRNYIDQRDLELSESRVKKV